MEGDKKKTEESVYDPRKHRIGNGGIVIY